MNPDFIGAGWAFPPTTDATGGIALVTREREVEQAIRLILGHRARRAPDAAGVRLPHPRPRVRPGERRDRRARSPTTCARRWSAGSPASSCSRSAWATTGSRPGRCTSTCRYEIVGSNDPRNLVFPFYVIPDQELTGPVNAPAELEV